MHSQFQAGEKEEDPPFVFAVLILFLIIYKYFYFKFYDFFKPYF
jgi:hypothetical protein